MSDSLFGPRVRRAILGLALVSSCAVVATLLFGEKLSPIVPTMRDSYGAGPLGHQAFAEVLEATGLRIRQSRGSRFAGPGAPLFFIEPDAKARVQGREHRLEDAIRARIEAARQSVVVLPKWNLSAGATVPTAVPDPSGAVERILDAALGQGHADDGTPSGGDEPLDSNDAPHNETPHNDARFEHIEARISLGDASGHYELGGLLGNFTAHVPRLQVIHSIPPAANVLLDCEYGAVIIERDGVVIVTDPDLLHNFNLHRAQHASLWVALAEYLGSDTLIIDEVFHGHGVAYSLKAALGEMPAALIVVQALLVVLLVVLAGLRRFGPPRAPPPLRHGPAESIAIAAQVLSHGQRLSVLVARYVPTLLSDLHERLGLPPASSAGVEAAHIDELARGRGIAPRAAELLGSVRALDPNARQDAWRLALDTHRFREELLGASHGEAKR